MHRMYLVQTPSIVQKLFYKLEWSYPTTEKKMYLTFDDGPNPHTTPIILDMLQRYDAKATFFCVGDNIRKHPEIYERLKDSEHRLGNHTYHHLNGWYTDFDQYLEDVNEADTVLETPLFRPPYGKLTIQQARHLSRKRRVIMWDVLSGDFDKNVSPDQCFANVVNAAKSGSVVVFHDSVKTIDTVKVVLPSVLEYFSKQGYTFEAIR